MAKEKMLNHLRGCFWGILWGFLSLSAQAQNPSFEIQLVDAETNQVLFNLEDGMDISLNATNLSEFSIVLAQVATNTESASMVLNGPVQQTITENVPPYALFRDSSNVFFGADALVGTYQFEARLFDQNNLQGNLLSSRNIEFTFFVPPALEYQLVNAETNQVLFTIDEGQVIDLDALALDTFNIVTSVVPSGTQSVRLELQGAIVKNALENVSPFTLFGDNGPSDFKGIFAETGSYQLRGEAFSEKRGLGNNLGESTLHFSFIRSNSGGSDIVFSLVNSDTDQILFEIQNGQSIDLGPLNLQNFSVIASSFPNNTESVSLSLGGPVDQLITENVPPYALFSDSNGDFAGVFAQPGAYLLTGRAFDANQLGGNLIGQSTITFSFVNSDPDFEVFLINSDTDSRVIQFQDGATINLWEFNLSQYNLEASEVPNGTQSVEMTLEGPFNFSTTSNVAPYSVFGVQNGNDFLGTIPSLGTYTLTIRAFSQPNGQGNVLRAQQVRFTFIFDPQEFQTEIILVDAQNDVEVAEFVGQDINLDQTPLELFNFEITVFPPETQSVTFQFSGPIDLTRTENQAPFTAFGDQNNGSDYLGLEPIIGTYLFVVTTWDEKNGGGRRLSEDVFSFSFETDNS
ncbi:MAG: hypothetical protein AAFU64_01665, partial [Bacteroidota bacterium]